MWNTNEHKTAILVFALSSQEELKCKKINNAQILFQALSDHTLKTVQKTGLPYFHLTEKNQRGNSFGERFTNAINFIFDRGFDQIITIGNDSPHLKASQILKSAAELSAGKAVLGPSMDGGFYLMGLHKTDFNIISFKNLPWQTAQLWKQFRMELDSNKVEVVELKRLLDIDSVHDLNTILKFTKGLANPIFKVILSLLFPYCNNPGIDSPILGLFQLNQHHNRGSPLPLGFQSV